jgi:hypothetical protein
MEHVTSLIKEYRASDGDPSVVSDWWDRSRPSPRLLVAISEEIGALYLAGELTYALASGLMNQLMPLAEWEQAPQRFWQYYIAFEDAETLAEPDAQARLAVRAVAKAGAA